MPLLDALANSLDNRAPVTGAALDLERGRKSGAKLGALLLVHFVSMLVTLAAAASLVLAVIGIAAGTLASGAIIALGLGFGTMTASIIGANSIFRRDGEHINAYQDQAYPEKAAKRVQEMKPIAETFNHESAITTDSPVTTMKPLKFQTRNRAQPQQGAQS